ncbi:MAG: hypothetical protein Q7T86_11730 [Hyphomicrobiaceae bacterium]|nr:hypothetical protein [Hyphomicrobiaceae bacterium]
MRYLKFIAPVLLLTTPPLVFAGVALAGSHGGCLSPEAALEAASTEPPSSCRSAIDETANRSGENAQIIVDLRNQLIESNQERDRLKRRNFISAAVALRRSEAILGLRDFLAGSADARGASAGQGEPETPSATNATITQLQDDLSLARRDSQRAIATAVYQRQQHSESSKTVASLRVALAALESQLNEVRSGLKTASLEASSDVAESSATIAKLQETLEAAQRASQRAIGQSLFHRQRHNDALKAVAALQQDLETAAAELSAARTIQQTATANASDIPQLTAEIADLKRSVADARRDAHRAIAVAVFQRQQRNVAETAVTSMRVALAKSDDELRDAHADIQAEKSARSSSDADASAKIAKLQDGLEAAQRASQRAIGISVSHRQRSNDALKAVATLQQDLQATAAKLSEARAIQQAAAANSSDIPQLTAEIAELQRNVATARRDGQRAIATAVFQRQQRNLAETAVTSLRVALAKTGEELRTAQAAQTAMSTNDTEASAKIAKLEASLEELQRTNQRSIANAVLHRQRWATSSQAEAKLQAERDEQHAKATKLSVAFAELRTELDKIKSQTDRNTVSTLDQIDERNEGLATEVAFDDRTGVTSEPALHLADYGDEPAGSASERAREARSEVPRLTQKAPPVLADRPTPLSQTKPAAVRKEPSKASRTAILPHRRRSWREPASLNSGRRDVIVVTAPVRRLAMRKPAR